VRASPGLSGVSTVPDTHHRQQQPHTPHTPHTQRPCTCTPLAPLLVRDWCGREEERLAYPLMVINTDYNSLIPPRPANATHTRAGASVPCRLTCQRVSISQAAHHDALAEFTQRNAFRNRRRRSALAFLSPCTCLASPTRDRSMTSNLRYFLEAIAHVPWPVWTSQFPRAIPHCIAFARPSRPALPAPARGFARRLQLMELW